MLENIRCITCGKVYPDAGLPYQCPDCSGVMDYCEPFTFQVNKIEKDQPGIWKFRHSFGLGRNIPSISLGEGDTPLLWENPARHDVGYKLESLNPSGSYKDRGSAVVAAMLKSRGATSAVEDSSGNAGASFAAYCARAGIRAKIFVPGSASGPKLRQIERSGAELIKVPGPRSAATQALMADVSAGAWYGSHAWSPFTLPGIATIAYEIWQELGQNTGTIISPVGQGGLLLGIIRGFQALQSAGLIQNLPFFVGVQAGACAPLSVEYNEGSDAAALVEEKPTIAEGVRVRYPTRGKILLDELRKANGRMLAIPEDRILPACLDLARKGIYVEPTSALAECTLAELRDSIPLPVVLILTGSGLKYYTA